MLRYPLLIIFILIGSRAQAQFGPEEVAAFSIGNRSIIGINDDLAFTDSGSVRVFRVSTLDQLQEIKFTQRTTKYNRVEKIDVDQDGDEDLIAYGNNTTVLDFYEYKDQKYSYRSDIKVPVTAYSAHVEDYDGDGLQDIWVSVSLYRNNGNQTFTRILTSNSSYATWHTEQFFDFDLDGDKDVLQCTNHMRFLKKDSTTVLKSSGLLAAFNDVNWIVKVRLGAEEKILYYVPGKDSIRSLVPSAINVGYKNEVHFVENTYNLPEVFDLDGDGYDEIIHTGANTVHICYYDKTKGIFLIKTTTNTAIQDVAILRNQSAKIAYVTNEFTLLCKTSSDFALSIDRSVFFGVGSLFYKPQFRDFDGDGFVDILKTEAKSGDKPLVKRYLGNGNFEPTKILNMAKSGGFVDLDKDGDQDFYNINDSTWRENIGTYDFKPWIKSPYALPPTNPAIDTVMNQREAGKDLDGDGKIDYLPFPGMTGDLLTQVYRDVDLDGDLDVIACSDFGTQKFGWFRNDGNLKFTFINLIPTTPVLNNRNDDILKCAVQDLNNDGYPDVIFSTVYYGGGSYDGVVAVYLGSAGGLKFHKHILNAKGYQRMSATDLDNDKKPDFVIDNFNGIYHFRAINDFIAPVETIHARYGLNNVVSAADLNSDGNLDLISYCMDCYGKVSDQDDRISYFINSGKFPGAIKPLDGKVSLLQHNVESSFAEVKVLVLDSLNKVNTYITDANGRFKTTLYNGKYTLSTQPEFDNDLWTVTKEIPQQVQLVKSYNSDTITASYGFKNNCSSIQSSLLPIRSNVCSEISAARFQYINKGNVPARNVLFTIVLPKEITDVMTGSPMVYDKDKHQITLLVDSIAPFERSTFALEYRMPCSDTLFNLCFEHTIEETNSCGKYHTPNQTCLNQFSNGPYNFISLTKWKNIFSEVEDSVQLEYLLVYENTKYQNINKLRMEFPLPKDGLISPPNLHFFSHPCTRKIENGILVVEFDNLNLVQRSLDSNLVYFSFINSYTGQKEFNYLYQNGRVVIDNEFKESYISVYNLLNYSTATTTLVAERIHIVPNPANAEIRITGLHEANYVVTILDIFGRKIHNVPNYQAGSSIDLSAIASGTYSVILEGRHSKIIKKLVKIN